MVARITLPLDEDYCFATPQTSTMVLRSSQPLRAVTFLVMTLYIITLAVPRECPRNWFIPIRSTTIVFATSSGLFVSSVCNIICHDSGINNYEHKCFALGAGTALPVGVLSEIVHIWSGPFVISHAAALD